MSPGPQPIEKDEDVAGLAREYLRFHETDAGDAVAVRIDYLVTTGQPASAWPVIVAAIEMTEDEQTLAKLGAGDLENIIRNHGPEFIDRIEEQARISWRFRRALKALWATESPVWSRVESALDVP